MLPTPYKHLPGTTQALTTGAAAVSSAAFGAQTYAVRVVCTAACHIAFGPAPVATANDAYLAPGVRGEFIGVTPGEKLSVIQDTASGKLYVTELTR